jgi:hypothetical protein
MWMIEVINLTRKMIDLLLILEFQNALLVPHDNKGLVTILVVIFGK